jgi:uncharacterized protein YndB with AHSA1/START domain
MSTPNTATFRLTYTFNAPKQMVFEAFSNAEALNAWWGPVETENKVVSLDFRPAGIFHFSMKAKNGAISYGRFLFQTIQPYDLLEFTNAFADANANIVKAPFDIPLPVEIAYRLEFTEVKGKTTIHLTGKPVGGSEEEIAGFRAINEGMEQGFGATFGKLAEYLKISIK